MVAMGGRERGVLLANSYSLCLVMNQREDRKNTAIVRAVPHQDLERSIRGRSCVARYHNRYGTVEKIAEMAKQITALITPITSFQKDLFPLPHVFNKHGPIILYTVRSFRQMA